MRPLDHDPAGTVTPHRDPVRVTGAVNPAEIGRAVEAVTQVRIPPVLRESAGGTKQVELEGGTVGDVLQQLVDRFPALRDQLFTADGALNRFVNVYLNDEDVRYLSELATPAGERDSIVVLPAMAGGAPARTLARSFRYPP